MSSSDILVTILGITLAIFLILGIVLVGYLIAIARQLQQITNSAARAVDAIENITTKMQRAVAPAVASQFIMEQISRIVSKMTDKKRRDQPEDEA